MKETSFANFPDSATLDTWLMHTQLLLETEYTFRKVYVIYL